MQPNLALSITAPLCGPWIKQYFEFSGTSANGKQWSVSCAELWRVRESQSFHRKFSTLYFTEVNLYWFSLFSLAQHGAEKASQEHHQEGGFPFLKSLIPLLLSPFLNFYLLLQNECKGSLFFFLHSINPICHVNADLISSLATSIRHQIKQE